jgi:hypothetical protein
MTKERKISVKKILAALLIIVLSIPILAVVSVVNTIEKMFM